MILCPGDEVAEVQRQAHHEGLVVEVDEVLLGDLLDHAPHRCEVLRHDVILEHRLDRLVLAGSDHPGREQVGDVLEVTGVELDLEVLLDDGGQRHRNRTVEPAGGFTPELPVLPDPFDGNGHVQQHGVDAVLVDEVPLRVEHRDEVGLELAQTLEGELALQLEEALGALAAKQSTQKPAVVAFAPGEGDPAAGAGEREAGLLAEGLHLAQIGFDR